MNDLYNTLDARQSINLADRSTAVNGSGVDLQGYEGAVAIVSIGAGWVGTDGTIAITLEESTDNATFTAVAAADRLGTLPTLSGFSNRGDKQVGYKGNLRYLRAVGTPTGATTAVVYGVVIIRGLKRHSPPTFA